MMLPHPDDVPSLAKARYIPESDAEELVRLARKRLARSLKPVTSASDALDHQLAVADLVRETTLWSLYRPAGFSVEWPWRALQALIDSMLPGDVHIIGARTGVGKALALDTPIPTPVGWTSMGTLRIGDALFDERGQPCRVRSVTAVQQDRACFAITFSDGERIIADADHLWETFTYEPRGGVGIRTTAEIAATLRAGAGANNRWNHKVRVAAALELPEASLPIAPYALGAWLGDGHSDGARITCAEPELIGALATEGVEASLHRSRGSPQYGMRFAGAQRGERDASRNLHTQLRRLGVLGNKRIPDLYLRGSCAQRSALLQGLMDTDGSVDHRGCCEFSSMRRSLADGTLELVRSLGMKATVRVNRASVGGRDVGERYRVTFWPAPGQQVFRLRRKADRLAGAWSRHRSRGSTAAWRYIVAADPVASVPVRCIEVDSESRLYLAGRSMIPTHNTTMLMNVVDALIDRIPGIPVKILPFETPPWKIMNTLSAIRLGYDPRMVLRGKWDELPGESHQAISEECERLTSVLYRDLLLWTPQGTLNPAQVMIELERAHDCGVRVVVLDHLHRVELPGRNQEQELRRFMRALKDKVERLELIVVAGSQLSRGERDPLKRYTPPLDTDLRGAGALEEEADGILGMYLPIRSITVAQMEKIRRNMLSVKPFVMAGKTAIRVLKSRVDGERVVGSDIHLQYVNGRLIDDTTAA